MYLGVRYDHFTKMDGKSRYYDKNTGALTRSLDYDEVSYSEFSPKIAFDYKADEKTNYYVPMDILLIRRLLYQSIVTAVAQLWAV